MNKFKILVLWDIYIANPISQVLRLVKRNDNSHRPLDFFGIAQTMRVIQTKIIKPMKIKFLLACGLASYLNFDPTI